MKASKFFSIFLMFLFSWCSNCLKSIFFNSSFLSFKISVSSGDNFWFFEKTSLIFAEYFSFNIGFDIERELYMAFLIFNFQSLFGLASEGILLPYLRFSPRSIRNLILFSPEFVPRFSIALEIRFWLLSVKEYLLSCFSCDAVFLSSLIPLKAVILDVISYIFI